MRAMFGAPQPRRQSTNRQERDRLVTGPASTLVNWRKRANRSIDNLIRAFESRRKLQLFVVTIAALTIAAYVTALSRQAASTREQWGTRIQVLVAAESLDDGDVITINNTRMTSIPQHLVSANSVREISIGTRIVRAINANEIITSLDIDSGQTDTPDGWRIVAFPADLVTPELHVGDHVDVIASGTTIANDVIVTVAPTSERGAEIAVPSEVAALVAGAAANGDASLVIAN